MDSIFSSKSIPVFSVPYLSIPFIFMLYPKPASPLLLSLPLSSAGTVFCLTDFILLGSWVEWVSSMLLIAALRSCSVLPEALSSDCLLLTWSHPPLFVVTYQPPTFSCSSPENASLSLSLKGIVLVTDDTDHSVCMKDHFNTWPLSSQVSCLSTILFSSYVSCSVPKQNKKSDKHSTTSDSHCTVTLLRVYQFKEQFCNPIVFQSIDPTTESWSLTPSGLSCFNHPAETQGQPSSFGQTTIQVKSTCLHPMSISVPLHMTREGHTIMLTALTSTIDQFLKSEVPRELPLAPSTWVNGQWSILWHSFPTRLIPMVGDFELTVSSAWNVLSLDVCMAHFLPSSRCLLKCHLLRETCVSPSVQYTLHSGIHMCPHMPWHFLFSFSSLVFSLTLTTLTILHVFPMNTCFLSPSRILGPGRGLMLSCSHCCLPNARGSVWPREDVQ